MEEERNLDGTGYVWDIVSISNLLVHIGMTILILGKVNNIYNKFLPFQSETRFTASHMNQGGALIQVYRDGSILLSHGGTEMGQGLFTKTIQVCLFHYCNQNQPEF